MKSKLNKYFYCKHCHKIVEVLVDSKAKLVCCGEEMIELTPNTTDAANEKHVPVIKVNHNQVTVEVGSVTHPMSEEHYITFIELLTNKGSYRQDLKPNMAPSATFYLAEDEEVLNAVAFCNLHSLWAFKN